MNLLNLMVALEPLQSDNSVVKFYAAPDVAEEAERRWPRAVDPGPNVSVIKSTHSGIPFEVDEKLPRGAVDIVRADGKRERL